jgi:integrase
MPRKTYKKLLVTKELLDQVNPDNIKLVEQFLKEKSIRSSDATIKGYRSDSSIFFVYNLLHNGNKHFTKIKKLELIDFFAYATDPKELGWGSSRANRMRSFISSLSQFIERVLDDEFPDYRSVILKAVQSVPKEERREKTVLSNEQIEDLLQYLSKTNSQQAAWIGLAAFSGSRFAELLRFTVDNISEDRTAFDGLFLVTKNPIRTKGRGRNGKMLQKYILRERFLPYYRAWLVERTTIMEKFGQSHNFLFIRDDGTPAIEGTVRSWITSMENYLQCNLYPHALRHFLVTEFSKKGIPPMLIKHLVGWSSINMVELYDDTTAENKEWAELENLK